MNISINLIKEFINLPKNKDYGDDLTKFSSEVDSVHQTNALLSNLIIAEIKEINKHPDADKLSLVMANIGELTVEIVCGAANLEIGMKVPYAAIGTKFCDEFTLEKKKIRGIYSNGMLCGGSEIGLDDGVDGLLKLDPSFKAGDSLLDCLKLESDTILEVDNKSITNRSDLWGHYGIAREFSAIYNLPLNKEFNTKWEAKVKELIGTKESPIKIEIQATNDCINYSGICINNIKVEESPKWLKTRLQDLGFKPINNLVDIGNYVMIELGNPLHFFDRDLISGDKILIKENQSDSKFTCLDDNEVNLTKDDLVIADSEKNLVIAGVIGGKNSSISEDTKSIFIEVANFKAETVRKTSKNIGIRTESSSRFEKRIDPALSRISILRAVELVKEICPDAEVDFKIESVGDINGVTIELKVNKNSFKRYLGIDFSKDQVVDTLNLLGFSVVVEPDFYNVTVPSFRAIRDFEHENDIVEEVARIYGYNNIKPLPLSMDIEPVNLSPLTECSRVITDFFVNRNYFEIMSYPLIGEDFLNKFSWGTKNQNLSLTHPLSKDRDRLRPALMPQLIDVGFQNSKNFDLFNIFEIGTAFIEDSNNFVKEELTLAGLSYNSKESGIIGLIDDLEDLLSKFKLKVKLVDNDKIKNPVCSKDWAGVNSYQFLNIQINGSVVGSIFRVHPQLLKLNKVKGEFSVFELRIDTLLKFGLKDLINYQAINNFPSSDFDCTVVVDKNEKAENIVSAVLKTKNKHIVNCSVVTIFDMQDQKAVTLKTEFKAFDKTLGSDLIKNLESEVIKNLEKSNFNLKA